MLISFLLRPAAFDKACIVDKASAASARLLFQDILDAGVIIDFAAQTEPGPHCLLLYRGRHAGTVQ